MTRFLRIRHPRFLLTNPDGMSYAPKVSVKEAIRPDNDRDIGREGKLGISGTMPGTPLNVFSTY